MTLPSMDEKISFIHSFIDGSIICECHPLMEKPHPWMTFTDEDDRDDRDDRHGQSIRYLLYFGA